jgi:hypothetical protein
MKTPTRGLAALARGCIMVLVVLALFGCGRGAQQRLLQEQDWMGMPDEQLLEYYFALSDEIDRCERAGQRGSVGVGTGFGTGRVGFGIGVAQGVGGCPTQSLRDRRALVRRELIQRGLIQ